MSESLRAIRRKQVVSKGIMRGRNRPIRVGMVDRIGGFEIALVAATYKIETLQLTTHGRIDGLN